MVKDGERRVMDAALCGNEPNRHGESFRHGVQPEKHDDIFPFSAKDQGCKDIHRTVYYLHDGG